MLSLNDKINFYLTTYDKFGKILTCIDILTNLEVKESHNFTFSNIENLPRDSKVIKISLMTSNQNANTTSLIRTIHIGKEATYISLFNKIKGYKVIETEDLLKRVGLLKANERVLYHIDKESKKLIVYDVLTPTSFALSNLKEVTDYVNIYRKNVKAFYKNLENLKILKK